MTEERGELEDQCPECQEHYGRDYRDQSGMTDQEIIEHIDVNVMGRCLKKSRLTVATRGKMGYYERPFNPLASDADCMAAWDRFSDERETYLIHTTTDDGILWMAQPDHYATWSILDKDRRRAMCLCMVKAWNRRATAGRGK